MQHSDKKITIGLTAIVLVAITVAGCMRPKTYGSDDAGLGDASFSLGKVSIAENSQKEKKSEVVGQLEGFSIPSRKKFNLKTCLKTNKIDRPVAYASFVMTGQEVDGRERAPLHLVTDKNGCLSWSEEVSYNFFSEEAYFPVTRVLTAQGGSGQRGSSQIKLALNPWNLSGSAAELLDLNQKDAVPEGVQVIEAKEAALRLSGKSADSASKQLSVTRFALNALPSTGVHLTAGHQARVLQLTIQPAIRGRDALKKPVEFALSQARLEIETVLVAIVPDASGTERRYQVWISQMPASFVKTDQGFTALVSFGFQPVEQEKARYELLARVRPMPALEGLKPFEAVFTLGSHAQLMSSHVLPEKIQVSNVSDPNFSLTETVKLLEAPPLVFNPPQKPEEQKPVDAQPAPTPVPVDPPPASSSETIPEATPVPQTEQQAPAGNEYIYI